MQRCGAFFQYFNAVGWVVGMASGL